jgi:hypothetical protein
MPLEQGAALPLEQSAALPLEQSAALPLAQACDGAHGAARRPLCGAPGALVCVIPQLVR